MPEECIVVKQKQVHEWNFDINPVLHFKGVKLKNLILSVPFPGKNNLIPL